MPNFILSNPPPTLVASVLTLGLACGCTPAPPSDLRVDYTAVAIVPGDLASLYSGQPAPEHINALLDLAPYERAVVLDRLSLTTADRQHGELRGSRFALEQLHRVEDGERLLLAKVVRTQSDGQLKVERHMNVDEPSLLGRFSAKLVPRELTEATRRRSSNNTPEVELAVIAHARALD